MEKCTTAEGFVFHNAEPILAMPVILISIRNLYAHKIDVRPNLPGYIVSCCFKLNLEQTGSHQKEKGVGRRGKRSSSIIAGQSLAPGLIQCLSPTPGPSVLHSHRALRSDER